MLAWLKDRQTRRDLVWITLIALVVQAFWALRMSYPTYFDAFYYTTNAQRIAEGHGLTQEIIWQYLDQPERLPVPSFTYWMPLPAFIAALGYKVHDSFRAAQIPFWLMASFLPWMSYAIAWHLRKTRWMARTAALFTAAGGYYAAYWNQPTTFVLFAWAGGGCLLALAWAHERKRWEGWLFAGVLAGLSHLSRADGLLLLGVAGIIWLYDVMAWWKRRSQAQDAQGDRFAALQSLIAFGFIFVGGYLLVMGGWFWRTYQLVGSPMSTVGTQTIFLTAYNDLFSYGRSFDLASYLDWGFVNILKSKAVAASLGIQTFIAVTGLTVFVFFMMWAWIKLGCSKRTGSFLRPFSWYLVLLYSIMIFVFTFPGQRGSLLHSSVAVWPWSMALAAIGVDYAVDWMADRRPAWQPEPAKRLFAVVFVILVFVVSFVVSSTQPLQTEQAAIYKQVADMIPPDSVVMTGDPPGVYYHTRLPAVAMPNEPPEMLPVISEQLGVTHLLLDSERPPTLADLHDEKISLPALKKMHDFGDGYVLYQFVHVENEGE